MTSSHFENDFRQRLRAVDWSPLAGLARALVSPIGSVLQGAAADRILDRWLREHRTLSNAERSVAAEVLFGVGLWRRRVAAALGLDWRHAGPALLLHAFLRDLAGVDEALCTRWTGLSAPKPREASALSLADRWSVPDWLASLARDELRTAAEPFFAALAVPGPIAIRTNPLKTHVEALADRLASEGVSCTRGTVASSSLILDGRPNIYGLDPYRDGWFEVQDEGSQLLAELVDAGPGERVLDACAGAGGKTLALAAALANRGELWAYDVDRERLDRLERRAARAGVLGLRVAREAMPDGPFDAVLVDAPCSEIGALRRGPDLRWRLNAARFPDLYPTQRQILAAAASRVRPGGRLVYATCSISRAENEDAALAFEATQPHFHRTDLFQTHRARFAADGFLKTWPHRDGTDAFFAAVWRRAD